MKMMNEKNRYIIFIKNHIFIILKLIFFLMLEPLNNHYNLIIHFIINPTKLKF
jgi:hypothetical protein